MERPRIFAASFLLFFLVSCETQNQPSSPPDSNESQISSVSEQVPPPELVSPKEPMQPPSQLPMPEPAELKPIEKEEEKKPKKVPSAPQMPTFSEELLRAVQNWQRVPPSVFPLKSVSVQSALTFRALSPQGQVLATSSLPAGKEVVALGLRGTTLTVSPSLNSRLRATIDLANTDFKQGVAYLFELRKRQRAHMQMLEEERKRKLALGQSSPTPDAGDSKPQSSSNSLFEDLPEPGDYGHGKFCICQDCREKRLADTGSMK